MVEPVVVSPEVDSNKASTKLRFAEELANGIAHKIGNKNHNIFTTSIPNLGVTFGWSPKQAITTNTQKIEDIKPDQRKAFPPCQPVSTDVIQGINIKKEKNNPTYATISPADLTSFNSIDKTYLNFIQITMIDPLNEFYQICLDSFIYTLELATFTKIHYYANVSFKLTNNNMPTKTTMGGR